MADLLKKKTNTPHTGYVPPTTNVAGMATATGSAGMGTPKTNPGYAAGYGKPNKVDGASLPNPGYAAGYGKSNKVDGATIPNPGYADGFGAPKTANGNPVDFSLHAASASRTGIGTAVAPPPTTPPPGYAPNAAGVNPNGGVQASNIIFEGHAVSPATRDQILAQREQEALAAGSGLADPDNVTQTGYTPPERTSYQTDWEQSQYKDQADQAHAWANRDTDVSRHDIMGRVKQQALDAGFAPGTAEYNRMVDNAAASANVAGLENRRAAMTEENALRNKQYDQDNEDYEFIRDMTADEYKQVLSGLQDFQVEAMNSFKSSNDAAFTHMLTSLLNRVPYEQAFNEMMDPATGEWREEFRPLTKAEQERKAAVDAAIARGDDGEAAGRQWDTDNRLITEGNSATIAEENKAVLDRKALQEAIQAIQNGGDYALSTDQWDMVVNDPTSWQALDVIEKPSVKMELDANTKWDPSNEDKYNGYTTVGKDAVANALNKKGVYVGAKIIDGDEVWQVVDIQGNDDGGYAVVANSLNNPGKTKPIISGSWRAKQGVGSSIEAFFLGGS